MTCRICKEELIPGNVYVLDTDNNSVVCAKCCNQPERSKREDCTCSPKRKYLGLKTQCRCGALNTMET